MVVSLNAITLVTKHYSFPVGQNLEKDRDCLSGAVVQAAGKACPGNCWLHMGRKPRGRKRGWLPEPSG